MEKSKIKIIVLTCLILLFIILSLNLNSSFITGINDAVNIWITGIQVNFLVSISKATSYIFDTIPVLIFSIIISLILFLKKKRKESIILILTVGLSSLSVYLLKNLYSIPRPLNPLENGFAFPSGHSSIAIVSFGFLSYYFYKKFPANKLLASLISIFFIAIISFSRLYLNVHWLSDVIGGLILGSIWFIIALFFLKK